MKFNYVLSLRRFLIFIFTITGSLVAQGFEKTNEFNENQDSYIDALGTLGYTPVLTLLNDQILKESDGEFSLDLEISAWTGFSFELLPNIPITVSVLKGDGFLSEENKDTLSKSITSYSDTNGQVRASYITDGGISDDVDVIRASFANGEFIDIEIDFQDEVIVSYGSSSSEHSSINRENFFLRNSFADFGISAENDIISYSMEMISTFSTLQIPDFASSELCLWLKPEESSRSNNTISRLYDQSGKGNNFENLLYTAKRPLFVENELNGNPVIRFDNVDDSLTGKNNLLLQGKKSAELFVVLKKTGINFNPLFTWGMGGTSFFPRNNTEIYERFGVGVSDNSIIIPVSSNDLLNQWRIYNVSAGENVWAAYIDGKLILKKDIEARFLSPSYSHILSTGWGGDVAEVLVFERSLTDTERSEIERYLANKYGLSGVLIKLVDTPVSVSGSANNGNIYLSWGTGNNGNNIEYIIERREKNGSVFGDWESIATVTGVSYTDSTTELGKEYEYRVKGMLGYYESEWSDLFTIRVPSIVPISGMRLWLRADKQAWTYNNGTEMYAWTDQSSYKRDLDVGNGASLVEDSINGYPAVRFDGVDDVVVLGNSFSGVSKGEVFVILKSDRVDNGLWYFGGEYAGFYPNNTGRISDIIGSKGTNLSPIVHNLDQWHLYNVRFSSEGWSNFVNGSMKTNMEQNVVSFEAYQYLGFGGTKYFLGDVAEMIVYERALNDAEREQVHGYLMEKYAFMDVPETPEVFEALPLSTQSIGLRWNQVEDGNTYILEKDIGNGQWMELFESSNYTENVFTDSWLRANTTYKYRLRVKNLAGEVNPLFAEATTLVNDLPEGTNPGNNSPNGPWIVPPYDLGVPRPENFRFDHFEGNNAYFAWDSLPQQNSQAIAGFRVYVNGIPISNLINYSWSSVGLTLGALRGNQIVYMTTVDVNGRESSPSRRILIPVNNDVFPLSDDETDNDSHYGNVPFADTSFPFEWYFSGNENGTPRILQHRYLAVFDSVDRQWRKQPLKIVEDKNLIVTVGGGDTNEQRIQVDIPVPADYLGQLYTIPFNAYIRVSNYDTNPLLLGNEMSEIAMLDDLYGETEGSIVMINHTLLQAQKEQDLTEEEAIEENIIKLPYFDLYTGGKPRLMRDRIFKDMRMTVLEGADCVEVLSVNLDTKEYHVVPYGQNLMADYFRTDSQYKNNEFRIRGKKAGKVRIQFSIIAEDETGAQFVNNSPVREITIHDPVSASFVTRDVETGEIHELGGLVDQSNLAPYLNLNDVQATVINGHTLEIQVNGQVRDYLSEILDYGNSGTSGILFYLDGEAIASLVLPNANGSDSSTPWMKRDSTRSFSKTLRIPNVSSGARYLSVKTTPNIAGKEAYSNASIVLDIDEIGTEEGQQQRLMNLRSIPTSGLKVILDGNLSLESQDSITLFINNEYVVLSEAEDEIESGYFYGEYIFAGNIKKKISVKLPSIFDLNPVSRDSFGASIDFETPDGVTVINYEFYETASDSREFIVETGSEYVSPRKSYQVTDVLMLDKEKETVFYPIVPRVTVPETWLNNKAELVANINGKIYNLKRQDEVAVDIQAPTGSVYLYVVEDNHSKALMADPALRDTIAGVSSPHGDMDNIVIQVIDARCMEVIGETVCSVSMPQDLDEDLDVARVLPFMLRSNRYNNLLYEIEDVELYFEILFEGNEILDIYKNAGLEIKLDWWRGWIPFYTPSYKFDNIDPLAKEKKRIPELIINRRKHPTAIDAAEALFYALNELVQSKPVFLRSDLWMSQIQWNESLSTMQGANAVLAWTRHRASILGETLAVQKEAIRIGLDLTVVGGAVMMSFDIAEYVKQEKYVAASCTAALLAAGPFRIATKVFNTTRKVDSFVFKYGTKEICHIDRDMAVQIYAHSLDPNATRFTHFALWKDFVRQGKITQAELKDIHKKGIFSMSNPRDVLNRKMPSTELADVVAHHDYPVALEYYFMNSGNTLKMIDINDPMNARWMKIKNHYAVHGRAGGEFNKRWESFFNKYGDETPPTLSQIEKFRDAMIEATDKAELIRGEIIWPDVMNF